MFRRLALAAFALAALASPGAFAKEPVYTARFSNAAVEGYDAVAYFSEGKPVTGEKTFSTDYNGAEWLFASAENLAAFKAEPAKYAPQYGGFCAFAVALGKKLDGDPHYADIVDGKLYLFVNAEIFEKYKKDSKRILAKAAATWPSIQHKSAREL